MYINSRLKNIRGLKSIFESKTETISKREICLTYKNEMRQIAAFCSVYIVLLLLLVLACKTSRVKGIKENKF